MRVSDESDPISSHIPVLASFSPHELNHTVTVGPPPIPGTLASLGFSSSGAYSEISLKPCSFVELVDRSTKYEDVKSKHL